MFYVIVDTGFKVSLNKIRPWPVT